MRDEITQLIWKICELPALQLCEQEKEEKLARETKQYVGKWIETNCRYQKYDDYI